MDEGKILSTLHPTLTVRFPKFFIHSSRTGSVKRAKPRPLHRHIWVVSTFHSARGGGMTPPVCQWSESSCSVSRWSEARTGGDGGREPGHLWDLNHHTDKMCGIMALRRLLLLLFICQVFPRSQSEERKYFLNAVKESTAPRESGGWNLIARLKSYLHFRRLKIDLSPFTFLGHFQVLHA